jgi:glycosyltransferase involved in cell wall biosynthesis
MASVYGVPKLISIVIPARNEAENLPRVEQAMVALAASQASYQWEFLVIDNASTDDTGRLAVELCRRDKRWRYIRFSRNYTVEASITAGYEHSKGDAIVVLYSDLQDPPEVIPKLVTKWEEGFDVVYGVRTERAGDPAWRNAAAWLAYRLIAWFSDVPIPKDTGDFRLISARVRDALRGLGETNRYMRGLIAWIGFKQTGVSYERKPRLAGKSNAPLMDAALFAFNAITSFSMRPLRLFALFGFVVLAVSVALTLVYVGLWLNGSPPPGFTTLLVLLLVGIGINSLGIGILGEYLGRTFSEVKRRPLYVIEQSENLD